MHVNFKPMGGDLVGGLPNPAASMLQAQIFGPKSPFNEYLNAKSLTNKTLNACIAKGNWTASGTWTLPAFTLGGTVTLNGQMFSGAALFNSSLSASGAISSTGGNISTAYASGNGGSVSITINNTNTDATSLAALRLQTGVSGNVWQLFARNNGVTLGIEGLADYITCNASGMNGVLGATTPAAGAFTTVSGSSQIASTGGFALGSSISGTALWQAGGAFLQMNDSTRSSNNRIMDWFWSGGVLYGRFVNDTYGAATNWITVTGGYAAGTTSIAFTGPVAVTGALSATTTIATGGYTVGTLPAGTIGMRAYVTDALAPTYNGVLVGGGAVKVPAFYNGTAWVSA